MQGPRTVMVHPDRKDSPPERLAIKQFKRFWLDINKLIINLDIF